jgi:hypothetical protein
MLDELAAEEMLTRVPAATYAETDEQRDARDKSADYERKIEPKVEVMLMMSVPERQEFVGYLGVLRRHYEIDSAKECVFKCVRDTARILEDGEQTKERYGYLVRNAHRTAAQDVIHRDSSNEEGTETGDGEQDGDRDHPPVSPSTNDPEYTRVEP